MMMPLTMLVAGGIAGLVLGLFGAGGTVVALPLLLYVGHLRPHEAIGTNALGVAATAAALLAWRLRSREIRLGDGTLFTLPGLVGIAVGAQLGLAMAGHRLIFLLGLVVFAVAGWIFYLARHLDDAPPAGGAQADGRPPGLSQGTDSRRRLTRIASTAVVVGVTAGFFGVGGGFLIVPGLSWAGEIDLRQAARAGLLPIAAFAALIGIQYLLDHEASLALTGLMLAGGMAGGALGIWLTRRVPRRLFQQAFAAFLLLIATSMVLH